MVLATVENGHDARMRHLSHYPRSLMHARISRSLHPHGDAPANRIVEARVDLARCAVTDAPDDYITPDSRRMTTVVQGVGPPSPEATARQLSGQIIVRPPRMGQTCENTERPRKRRLPPGGNIARPTKLRVRRSTRRPASDTRYRSPRLSRSGLKNRLCPSGIHTGS